MLTMGPPGEVTEEAGFSDLLKEAKRYGILNISLDDLEGLKNEIMARKRDEIIKTHEAHFAIVQCGDGRWRTFLPNERGTKGKEVKKKDKQKLYDAIVAFYQGEEEAVLFVDCYKEWKQHHFLLRKSGPNTIAKYESDYKRFLQGSAFEKTPIQKITDIDIDEFFLNTILHYRGMKNEEGLTYKAFTRLYGYLEGTFHRAYRRRIIKEDPMQYLCKTDYHAACRVPDVKTAETETLTVMDFNRILEQLYKDMEKHPDYLPSYAVELAALTGMRVAEIAALKWSDFDFDEMVITISRSDKYNSLDNTWSVQETKTKKSRKFPIDSYILRSLRRLEAVHEEYYPGSDWLFPHKEYGWIHSNIISSCLKNKCKQVGLKRTYGIHAFRKTLNSDLRSSGVPAILCAGMLGNSIDVNNAHYTYDTSEMGTKRERVSAVHSKWDFH